MAQTALSTILLVGAVLLLQSFDRIRSIDPGFDAERVLAARVMLPSEGYSEEHVQAFYARVLERLQAIPGAQSAAVSDAVPLAGFRIGRLFVAEGEQPWPAEGAAHEKARADHSIVVNSVSDDYFRTFGVPLIEGRSFDRAATIPNADAVIINQSMARRTFGDESAIGRRIRFEEPGPHRWRTVIGVAADYSQRRPHQEVKMESYLHMSENLDRSRYLALRARGDVAGIAQALRRIVEEEESGAPIKDLLWMEDRLAQTYSPERFRTLLLGLFAGLALLLSAAGIYGTASYAVTQRRADIGVRIALGAQAADVYRGVFSRVLRLVGAGGVVGLLASAALSGLIESFLFEVDRWDPASFSLAAAALCTAALVAAYLPARRAASIDPTRALRAD